MFVRHRKGGTIYFHIYGTSGDLNTISQMLDVGNSHETGSEKSFHGTSEKMSFNFLLIDANWEFFRQNVIKLCFFGWSKAKFDSHVLGINKFF